MLKKPNYCKIFLSEIIFWDMDPKNMWIQRMYFHQSIKMWSITEGKWPYDLLNLPHLYRAKLMEFPRSRFKRKVDLEEQMLHEITFEGFVTAPNYSCDSTINRKMTSYEALTSSDVLISHSDSRLDNFIRLLLNGPLESHWIRGLKLTSKFRAVQFWVNWKKMTTKSERRTSVSSSTVCYWLT